MFMTLTMILALSSGGLLATYLVLYGKQQRHYRHIQSLQQDALPTLETLVAFTPPSNVPDFASKIAVIPNLLPTELFERLRKASALPTHGTELRAGAQKEARSPMRNCMKSLRKSSRSINPNH